MKPHSLRRGLWYANFVLGAAVIGVAAWFVLGVRPAVAKVVGRKANVLPAAFDAVRKEYKARRVTGLKWKPTAPVSEADIKKVVIRADYEKKSPRHWIFSGPLPPVAIAATGPVDTAPPPPEGLDVLGTIGMVTGGAGRGYTIGFKFGDKMLAFAQGEFVRQSATDPARFKLTDVKEVRAGAWEVTYEVYGKDAEKPERTGKMTYEGADLPPAPWLRPLGPEKPNPAGAVPAGVVPAGTAPAGTAPAGTAPAGTATAKADAAKDGAASKTTTKDGATVIDMTAGRHEVRLEDLKPEIEINPRNHNQRAIKFNRDSYDYFRGRKAKSIATTVKTNIAKDKNGRVLGLRVTGFAKDAPADLFDVRRGDILVSIAGQKVASRSDAVRIAEHLDPKRIVSVVIDRNGKLITYRVDPNDPKNRRKVRYFDNLK